ncbi:redoxin domain-containing protein [Thalassobius vesicularis]|uniref:Redoxin domain-containing protein n=1 Tax=Thalassobius vesicularis TaxID=1294297 RepID=A0A4S3MEQ5_9RHOB|nr:redoxin domain-containing protein [Thalassobius vesicularis]THD76776.1 redoxin domain-containing protein [Thalassobius vesicularis]
MATRLFPGQPVPALRFAVMGHGGADLGQYDVGQDAPPGGTHVVFHRGRHCKWTRLMLKELDDRIGDFAIRGIRVVAVSAEDRDTTARLKDEMQLIRLPLGHSVDATAVAQEWGLFLTRNSTEPDAPALHFEPAQIWVKADGTLGGASVQSLPNFWPDVTQTLRGIENTLKKFPERGAG